jgi:hypothetical protein
MLSAVAARRVAFVGLTALVLVGAAAAAPADRASSYLLAWTNSADSAFLATIDVGSNADCSAGASPIQF